MDASTLASATIPVIVGICAIVNFCIKNIFKNADRLHDFIPTISCCLGLALSLVQMAIAGAPFTLEVVFSGMASGLAATGAYEMLTHWRDTSVKGEHVED